MQISLRSQLAAGMAVAGAAAIAVAPITQPQLVQSLEQVTANVQLNVWSNPITSVIDTLGMGAAYLLGTGLAANPATNPYNVGGTGPYASDYFPLIPWAPDPTDPEAIEVAAVPLGWLPQLLNPILLGEGDGVVSGTPLLSVFLSNLSGYTEAALEGLNGLAGGVGAAVFGVPLAVFQVISAVIEGAEVPDIATLIQETIIDPVVTGLSTFTQAFTYISSSVLANVTTLIAGLPALAVSAFGQATAALGYIANQTVTAFTEAFASDTIEDGWNALVDGLLGPDGALGSVLKLSVGFGVGIPDADPADSTFIPSLRQLVSGFGISGSQLLAADPVPPLPVAGASLRTSAGSAATRSRTGARAAAADGASNPAKRSTARAGARASASR